jgi:hypothetical protein
MNAKQKRCLLEGDMWIKYIMSRYNQMQRTLRQHKSFHNVVIYIKVINLMDTHAILNKTYI